MNHCASATRGIVTAPHHLAAQAGLAILREGGNAVEAMVAAAAAIAVVYPHMNALGGDGFWLIAEPGRDVIGIDACGAAGNLVDHALYARLGLPEVPSRGALAANTVAGAISGWQQALELAARWSTPLALDRLFSDAIYWAEHGVTPSSSQIALTAAKLPELAQVPGFLAAFAPSGAPPDPRRPFKQPRLAATLRRLAREGLASFYRGALARTIAADLQRAASPLTLADLERHRARLVKPLSIELRDATLYNMPPPTQGLATLLILGLYDQFRVATAESYEYLHTLIECTKQAFLVRDAHVTDPAYMSVALERWLNDDFLQAAARSIDPQIALPWPHQGCDGDTVWMGAIDSAGRAVSFIQSIYWEFGSGVVLNESGILWQNRGSSFQLAPGARQELRPGRKPFHTLNPSAARFRDGRTMVFGAMGGEGQPQTQAAVFTRYARHGFSLQQAVSAPRWLLGRTWGAQSTTLKLEQRFDERVIARLRAAGHAVELVREYDDLMGHAGAAVRYAQGVLEGATDPRSDGGVAAY
jgi:gamma-glutamyltranspeptidase/glutathione hydrolase